MTELPDHDALAASLAEAAPTAAGLDALDFDRLSPAGEVLALQATERNLRHAYAVHMRALGASQRRSQAETGVLQGQIESEIGAAMRWPINAVKDLLSDAGALVRLFPETLAALSAGQVSWQQAQALVRVTANVSDEHARAVQDRVLPRMPTQSAARTRQHLRDSVHAIDPGGGAERQAQAAKRSRVELRPEDDGMATLSLYTKAETARAIFNKLDAHCKKRAKGDTRTLDLRRADALAALVLTGRIKGSGSPRTPVMAHLVVNVETLAGLSDAPGQLEGYGSVPARVARLLATEHGSVWRRVFVNPTGALLAVDKYTYRPGAALDRYIRALCRTCNFPGCEMPARRCDLDHMHAFASGGCTDEDNLGPLCRKHHNEKTAGLWDIKPVNGSYVFTSLVTGHVYTSTPEPYPVVNDIDLIE